MDKDAAPSVVPIGPDHCVAVAASAGGLAALSALLQHRISAPVLVVQHLAPKHPSHLADLLDRHSPMAVREAKEGDPLVVFEVLIAPPDHHLLVNPDRTVSLTTTDRVHYVRPSADLLFGSVAEVYGPRSVGVVLTGTGQDGASGVQAIKEAGGTVVVQNPGEAQHQGMPQAAIATGCADLVLDLNDIGAALELVIGSGS